MMIKQAAAQYPSRIYAYIFITPWQDMRDGDPCYAFGTVAFFTVSDVIKKKYLRLQLSMSFGKIPA